jgi:drug/metabolite transporter (DMT)-like permease
MANDAVPRMRVALLTALAMIAFAGNSLLCRLALKDTAIDAASFTSVRIISGALSLWIILRLRSGPAKVAGSWSSALALFAYAAAFSFAYVTLSAGTGALLLFGAVNGTMIGYGLWTGERLRGSQMAGLVLAFAGLVGLVLPGLEAPPLFGAASMLGAGIAWGIYSLRGKGSGDATAATAGNFIRAVPFAIVLLTASVSWASVDRAGFLYAVISGALTSAVGYAIWYTALRGLAASSAATVQLSVPVIAAVAGVIFLGETITLRLVIASIAILGGIALVILVRQRTAAAASAPATSGAPGTGSRVRGRTGR